MTIYSASASRGADHASPNGLVGRHLVAHLVAVALVVAVIYLFRRQVDWRSWRDLGLVRPGRAQLVACGAGFGLGVLVLVGFFGVGARLGSRGRRRGRRAGRAAVVALLAAGLVMYAASALVQELAFRGYFF